MGNITFVGMRRNLGWNSKKKPKKKTAENVVPFMFVKIKGAVCNLYKIRPRFVFDR